MEQTTIARATVPRTAGVALIAGAVVLIPFNALFPRADDPWDTAGVLTMIAENATRRQISFLAITVGLWAVTAGVVAITRWMAAGTTAAWARYGALVGVALFTASVGLGLAATPVAVEWVAAGSDPSSADYAVAAALNVADDGVWFMSIIAYWGALGTLGVAMVSAATGPRWLGASIAVLGFATAAVVGVPLAFGIEAPALLLVFGVLAGLTTLWALATGTWILRSTR